jgi:hypothetical protein
MAGMVPGFLLAQDLRLETSWDIPVDQGEVSSPAGPGTSARSPALTIAATIPKALKIDDFMSQFCVF